MAGPGTMLQQQGPSPNRHRCGRRGRAPFGAAAAAGAEPQSAWLQQQGPSPNRRGCSSKSPAPIGAAPAAGA